MQTRGSRSSLDAGRHGLRYLLCACSIAILLCAAVFAVLSVVLSSYHRVSNCVVVCCSAWQCVAVHVNVLQWLLQERSDAHKYFRCVAHFRHGVLSAVLSSYHWVSKFVTVVVCCSALQCVAVCCSVLLILDTVYCLSYCRYITGCRIVL